MANNGGLYGGGGGSQANGGDGLIVVTYTPVNVATGIGILGALVCAAALAVTNPALGSVAVGPVHTSASLVATSTATGTGLVGPVTASGTISPAGQDAANGVGVVGPVAASGMWTAKVNATGSAVAGPVLTSATWGITDPAVGTVVLAPPIAVGGLIATNPLAGSAAVIPFAQGAWTATVNASGSVLIGPVSAHGTLRPLGATLPVDARYYAAAGIRGFYAALPERPFHSAASLRSFYILDNPDVTPTLDTKDPRETVVLTLDATSGLAAGETLTGTPTVAVTVMAGNDPNASSMVTLPQVNAAPVTIKTLQGTVTIATGQCVQAVCANGVNGCMYLVAATCTTSNPDKTLTLKAILPVSSY